jgi:hypothetical protein
MILLLSLVDTSAEKQVLEANTLIALYAIEKSPVKLGARLTETRAAIVRS